MCNIHLYMHTNIHRGTPLRHKRGDPIIFNNSRGNGGDTVNKTKQRHTVNLPHLVEIKKPMSKMKKVQQWLVNPGKDDMEVEEGGWATGTELQWREVRLASSRA